MNTITVNEPDGNNNDATWLEEGKFSLTYRYLSWFNTVGVPSPRKRFMINMWVWILFTVTSLHLLCATVSIFTSHLVIGKHVNVNMQPVFLLGYVSLVAAWMVTAYFIRWWDNGKHPRSWKENINKFNIITFLWVFFMWVYFICCHI